MSTRFLIPTHVKPTKCCLCEIPYNVIYGAPCDILREKCETGDRQVRNNVFSRNAEMRKNVGIVDKVNGFTLDLDQNNSFLFHYSWFLCRFEGQRSLNRFT